jgi:site-specific DNA recombinase
MIAAIYARKSTDQSGVADDQKSIARQVEHARAYAVSKGWIVADAHVYMDDGISGAEFANRPGFLRLMNALKPRAPFQVLVMSEESRLGREAIETAYALKQLVQAGVRVFFYMENRERTLDSPTDKIMLSLTAFADELEREKARQRTYDAMLRKARAGHVCGGRVFGYDNIEILGIDGKRSHVERRINDGEAAIIRQIFELSVVGHGVKAITKLLNASGAPSPRAQCGRSQTWAPSSVREVLFRDVYRGVVTWNRTRKRNAWGVHKQAARPEADWLEQAAPDLQIVPTELWTAAHRRLADVRRIYVNRNRGQVFGRPALGGPSKYLLTGLALCGCCRNRMEVVSRGHGTGARRTCTRFYGCSSYHERGAAVCGNKADVPMPDADDIVIEALLDDVLDESMIGDAVDEAFQLLANDDTEARLATLEDELALVERERTRLAEAIAAGGHLSGLLAALQTREARRATLEDDRVALRAQAPVSAREAASLRSDLIELSRSWRRVLADDPTHARPIVSSLLKNRVVFEPLARGRWRLSGEGHLIGLFSRDVVGRGHVPSGIRTRVLALKGPRPGPLDDGDSVR